MSELIVYLKQNKVIGQKRRLQLPWGKHRLGKLECKLALLPNIIILSIWVPLQQDTLQLYEVVQIQKRVQQWIEDQGELGNQQNKVYDLPFIERGFLWYEPKLIKKEEDLIGEWPIGFLQTVWERQPVTDQVYLIDGDKEEILVFAKIIAMKCNHFTLVRGKREFSDDWEEERMQARVREWHAIIEEIYLEVGLMIREVSELPLMQQTVKKYYDKTYRPIVYDFYNTKGNHYRRIPSHAIYIDFMPNNEKSKMIQSNRNDVTYCTYANYLDISEENGYTVLV